MAVINLQRNHVGVQSVINQFADYAAAGQGAMLHHTDGYVYCIFARNYRNATTIERRLYMTRSNDTGLIWSDAIEISSGYWDDDIAIIQLDVNDTDSDIGVVFNRGTDVNSVVLTRVVIDKETGAANSPYDAITGSPENRKWPSILSISTGFLICCLHASSVGSGRGYVYHYTNASFTTNNWVETTKTVFPANEQGMCLDVKKLSNGHLAMVAAYRTALDGYAGISDPDGGGWMSNLPAGMMRCDVGAFFSDDEGSTWTAVQKLSNYTGTPTLDLVGILSVASASLEQLSDDRIVVAYQEHTASQFISPSTTLALPGGANKVGNMCDARYHTGHNMIISTGDDATYGGVFILDLTNQTVTRIYDGSTPALWTNEVVTIDLSADQNQLAVGLNDGGIIILNVSDADPANWTVVKELRETSTPALLGDSIFRVKWDGNTVLYFSYAEQTGATNWGGRYDTSDNTLVTLKSTYTANMSIVDFVVRPTKIVAIHATIKRIESINKTTGVAQYYSATTDQNATILYDDVNDKYLGLSGSNMTRFIDTGSAFTEEANYTGTSNPSWPGLHAYSNYKSTMEVPGKGFFCFVVGLYPNYRYMIHWYSFASEEPSGYRVYDMQLGLGENMSHFGFQRSQSIKDNTWLSFPYNSGIVFQNLSNVGRIRYGFFEYDPDTKQLITSGIDFYDVCNVNSVGTNMTKLQFPKFCRDDDNRLYFYFNRWDVDHAGGNEFAPVLGIVEPDVKTITAQVRIRQVYTSTFTGKAHLRNTYTSTLTSRMRIVFAQCIKAKCRIVPRQTAILTSRAAILSGKRTTIPVTFYVQKDMTTKVEGRFWLNAGFVRNVTIGASAHIIKTSTTRVVGHFIIPAPNEAFSGITISDRYLQFVTARCRIAFP